MHSKRSHEGVVLIDHRDSPGIPDAMAVRAGMPVGSGQGLFEAPTYTCSHCEKVVMINPLRNRERAYCRKCHHYICDGCGVILARTFECLPFKVRLQQEQERLFLAEQRGDPVIPANPQIIIP